ncbi:MAG: anti-sigma factor [Microbacteriaceae bacterium]
MTDERDLEFAEVEVQLGLATAPVTPSASLKASLMAQIAVTPQFAPLSAAEKAAKETAKETAEQSTEHSTPAATVTPITVSTSAQRPDVSRFDTPTLGKAEAKAKARWMSRAIVTVTSLAAAAALVIGGGVVYNNVLVPQQQYAQLDGAPDRQEASAEVAGGGTARLVWSNTLLSSALHVDGLEALPDDSVYELWYIGSTGARAAGTFTVGTDGATMRMLDGAMQAGDVVGVTVEPKGGSMKPTTDPIVAIPSA